LKSQKESFINRLRHILISQVELLSALEIDDSLPEDVQKVLRSSKSRKQIAMSSPGDEEIIEKTDEDNQPTISIEDNPPSAKKNSEKDDSKSQQSSEKKTASVEKKNEGARKLSESEINDYFKKGIQIDDLIETLNKKDKKK
jgi:hypothetical protein